jgi:predicted outer membrane repeat protein
LFSVIFYCYIFEENYNLYLLIYFIEEGGGIHSDYSLKIISCIFNCCWAGYESGNNGGGGGGIAISTKVLTLTNSIFLYCESRFGKIGGGIRVHNSGINCDNCTWINCLSNSNGGVICSRDNSKDINLTKCIFSYNTAGGSGGAIYSSPTILRCDNTLFFHNMASSKGGAIYGEKDIILTNVIFINNLKNGSGTCVLDNMSSGGAIFQKSGTLSLTNCLFNNNLNINNNCNSIFFL